MYKVRRSARAAREHVKLVCKWCEVVPSAHFFNTSSFALESHSKLSSSPLLLFPSRAWRLLAPSRIFSSPSPPPCSRSPPPSRPPATPMPTRKPPSSPSGRRLVISPGASSPRGTEATTVRTTHARASFTRARTREAPRRFPVRLAHLCRAQALRVLPSNCFVGWHNVRSHGRTRSPSRRRSVSAFPKKQQQQQMRQNVHLCRCPRALRWRIRR